MKKSYRNSNLSNYVIVDFILRHDRDAPGEMRFRNNTEHGYFIDPIPVQQLDQTRPTYRYTIMATGDDTCLDGTPEDCSRFDDGAGRLPYFSVPKTQNGATLGTPEEDNTFEITRSRNLFNDKLEEMSTFICIQNSGHCYD